MLDQIKLERKIAEKAQRYFMTGVSMITSTGSFGNNVMAAEWSMQISYEPFLIAVFIHEGTTTFKNIKETKEFGVNASTEQQTNGVNIAGGYSRKEIDKLKINSAFKFLKPQKINAPLIAGCIVNVECKLVTMKRIGDHTMVVGKAVAIRYDKSQKPLVYHGGRYFRIGPLIESFREAINVDDETFSWFYAQAGGKFVLKCAGVVIKSGNKILMTKNLSKNKSFETIPYTIPKRGENYVDVINYHLKKSHLDVKLKNILILKRFVLQNKKKIQRINFVLYRGSLKSKSKDHIWKNVKSDPLLRAIAC